MKNRLSNRGSNVDTRYVKGQFLYDIFNPFDRGSQTVLGSPSLPTTDQSTYACWQRVSEVDSMNSGLGVGLKEVVEVVGCDGLLQLGEDLLCVRAIGLDEFLFLVLGFDVGFALIPDEQDKSK